jgi:putative ABC transport system ATP-binding protein
MDLVVNNRRKLMDLPKGMRDAMAPTLRLDDVSYAYASSHKNVIDHLTVEFQPMTTYAVVGPSGAGKTTLLSLLSGLTKPTGGEVYYKGNTFKNIDTYAYRSQDAGVVFQSFNLLPSLTVSENILLSMDASGKQFLRPKKAIVHELLDKVRLQDAYYDERILHLSGGEQQRVAIARALSYDPDVIIADEPTGNLDGSTQNDIIDIFDGLAHDDEKCVIIVTHSPEVAERVDRRFTLTPVG